MDDGLGELLVSFFVAFALDCDTFPPNRKTMNMNIPHTDMASQSFYDACLIEIIACYVKLSVSVILALV